MATLAAVSSRRGLVAGLVLAVLLAPACAPAERTATTTASGDRSGLTLRVDVRRKGGSLLVATAVTNTRPEAVHLDATQCGRVADVALARTSPEPEGETYTGSLASVKELILAGQRRSESRGRFAPRRLTGGSDVPACVRPDKPVRLEAGATIEERWEESVTSFVLLEVGSEHTAIRAEVVESEAPDSLQFLDTLPANLAEEARRGRNLRVDQATAKVLDQKAVAGFTTLSHALVFDRMVEDSALRGFLAAQPSDSWRRADFRPEGEALAFGAVTAGYERAVTAKVSTDGRTVSDVRVPGPDDRTRVFARRPATLPPGIARIPEKDDYVLGDEIVPNHLVLPSGQVVVDGLSGDSATLPDRVAPGSYPVNLSVARYPGNDVDTVALASLVVSDAPTVAWREPVVVAVDGGTAGFTSAEGSEALARLAEDESEAFLIAGFDSLSAHDHAATELPIGENMNLVMFSTGVGDGGYPVFTGLDGEGRPTRFVMDFGLLHLDWPPP
jgi:hypothetical protein